MTDFIVFIKNCIVDLGAMLQACKLDIFNSKVSLLEICIGFIALCIIISVFWKGARSS